MLRFIALVAMTGALGAWVFGRLVLTRLPPDADAGAVDALRALARRTLAWCAGALAITAPLRVAAARDITLLPLASSLDRLLLLQGLIAALVAGTLVLHRHAPRSPRLVDAGLATVVLIAPWLAHAGSAIELRAVAIVVDILHMVAAGGWLGALALVTMAVMRARRSDDGPAREVALLGAFHAVAVVAAPVVFVTGLIAAWLRMGVPEGIASSTYSGLFVAKLLLVGVTGFIGAGHSRLATRRVTVAAPAQVMRSLAAECLLAVGVLYVTAVLVGTAPIG